MADEVSAPSTGSWWTDTYGSYKPYGDYTPYDKLKFEDLKIYSPNMSGAISAYNPYQTNLPVNPWMGGGQQQGFNYATGYTPMFQQYYAPQVQFNGRSAFSPFGQK